ncbi:membrane dipeptidase [Rhizobium viscosum]|uniref:membrane dipeptidase n=1 Tax=Rhizobium viscosum TaxID=1673 RepID=UPI0028A690ED|nr:membrane dipeptidase [Rhizobium viscosum]
MNRVGEDRVALGSDFDGTTVPSQIKDVSGVPHLFEALWVEPDLVGERYRNSLLKTGLGCLGSLGSDASCFVSAEILGA